MENPNTLARKNFLDNSLPALIALNWEKVAWATLLLVAVITHLYMLGVRAMSHDESLHVLYSWKLFNGEGYVHQPMMHGPLRFHLNALGYALFGVNDAVGRLPAALAGIATVGLFWFFRPYIGRLGAFLAAVMFAISPAILYYTRYIRDEPFMLLLLVWFVLMVFRYLDTRQPRWLYFMTIPYALLFTAMEIAYIFAGLFMAFFLLYTLLDIARDPWTNNRLKIPFFAALALSAAAALVSFYVVTKGKVGQAEPAAAAIFVVGIVLLAAAIFLAWRGVGQRLHTHPALDIVIWMATLAAPLFAAFLIRMFGWDPLDYGQTGIVRSLAVFGVMLLGAGTLGMLWGRLRWLASAAIFYVIYVLLFTTFFTNGQGIASGTIGSLGYWLAQQEVQRGGQPWYYYFLTTPMYEFLPLFLSIGGIITFFAARVWRQPAVASDGTVVRASSAALFILFTIWWALGSWAALTWAGEKMPWLTVYIALPLTILGGWWAGWVLERIDWAKLRVNGGFYLMLALPVLGVGLLALVRSRPFQDLTIPALSTTLQWIAAAAIVIGLLWMVVRWMRALGVRGTLSVVFLTVTLLLFLWTVRVSFTFNYVNFDDATELLVYAHGTPDIKRIMNEIAAISERTTGGKLIKVAYDDDSTWPLEWYLREYPNKAFFGATPSRQAVDAPIVLVGDKNDAAVKPYLGDDYVRIPYHLVWWPKQTYFDLTWDRIWNGIRDPEQVKTVWDVLWYRKYKQPLAEWDPAHRAYMYVRKDVAESIWRYGVGIAGVEAVPEVDPYAQGVRQVTAARVLGGSQGSTEGLFFTPRNVAVASDGTVYVADTSNHRIQVFDANGAFVRAWGSMGTEPGQFNEPWGIGIAPDGESIYVADTWNHRIQKFTRDGQLVTAWGANGITDGQLGQIGVFWGPRAVAVDDEGRVFVTDTGNKRIQVFDADGVAISQFGGGGLADGNLDEPVGLAVDADGNIYVADTWNQRVQVFDRNFQYLRQWPIDGWSSQSVVNKPYLAVADTPAGRRVYVTDPENYRVLVFDDQGKFIATFGQYGTESDAMMLPTGIAVDGQGQIYVADADAHRIMIFPPINE